MRFTIETLGCKVNQYESHALETLLRANGHEFVRGDCDVAIVNTCAVTGESARKSRQAARRLRREHPGALIVVTGCLSQISPEETAAIGADLVTGSGDRAKLVLDIEQLISDRAKLTAKKRVTLQSRVKVRELTREFESLPSGGVSGRTRAMLKLQDGCDNFCAYCVIPLARGRVRSLPLEQAAAEAAKLERAGYREVVITGIEISSYGKDLDGVTLPDVLRAVSAAAPNLRLRLSSLEPSVLTRELCDELAALPNLCDHFHLSLQSGCDTTLRRMRRKYNTQRFLEVARRLRERFPNCGMTADLIAGFPGETEDDFADTLAFLGQCAFSGLHVFPYSERPETAAAAMPDKLTNEVKARRAAAARAVGRRTEREFLAAQVGRRLEVLFEDAENGVWTGHAGNYCRVRVTSAENLHNTVANVLIKGVAGGELFGELDI
ncbi:MAG: tRNA (N(6)-L-threonylcarbamoyladenosine(37)-C(2))-methylthiotransferase MtaB [Oscillospiraceae bacterium]|jgi:threonylcarbamoyladenosine tRNA methylthiotransferase MtaB|nr:tRNA (N(6)-L-threonylcarbamoyladenosine(37)-C(2))-methylthiotransferase MtaB [Oscillospiraceae bacterium]